MVDQVEARSTFVPLPESLPEFKVGLLGVVVPKEWGMSLNNAQWNFMRDMRLEEIERRILAIEAVRGPESGWRCVDCKTVVQAALEPERCGCCLGRTFAKIDTRTPTTPERSDDE